MKKLMLVAAALCIGLAFGEEEQMKPYGGKGVLAIVNACDAPTGALQSAARKFGNLLTIYTDVRKGDWRLADAQKCFDAAKANAAVFVVKDKALPLSLVAMEGKWGMANVEGLDEKGVEKIVLRVASLVMGGGSSKYSASVMRPAFSASDVTKLEDVVTFDVMMNIDTYMKDLGFEPFRMLSKEEAIAEGYVK